jgi:S1-C subfamily serine protease
MSSSLLNPHWPDVDDPPPRTPPRRTRPHAVLLVTSAPLRPPAAPRSNRSRPPPAPASWSTRTATSSPRSSRSTPPASRSIAGDVITALGGTTITDSTDLVAAIATHQPGDEVEVTVRRGSGTEHLTVKLGTQPTQAASNAG